MKNFHYPGMVRRLTADCFSRVRTARPLYKKVMLGFAHGIVWVGGVIIATIVWIVNDFIINLFSSWQTLKVAGYVLLLSIFIPRIFPGVNWDFFYSKLTGSYKAFVDPSPTAPLDEYNIVPYATAPNHEKMIEHHLSKMGFMDSPEKIDAYIQSVAPNSPVTGQMVMKSAETHKVDARLMLALMHQDSHFGTRGLGAKTKNPGNVGNDDSGRIVRHPTWQSGVDAVAKWLSRNRRVKKPKE